MTPTPEDIALADSIVRRIANHHFNGEAMFEMDISRRHADLPAAHYTALLIAAHTAPLRELAEIGRLAVAHRRMGNPLEVNTGQWYAKLVEVNAACDAYLAKHPTEKL